MARSLLPTDDEIDALIVGPDSLTWQYGSDIRLFATLLYPLLLQVAHPTVSAGVDDYSDFEQRPWERFFRTLDYLVMLQYSGPEAASIGRRLRDLHKQIRGLKPDGERYSALEPRAYAWVPATLLDAYVTAHAHFGRPMRENQIEQFYREYVGMGRLVGLGEGDLAPNWRGFRRYFGDVVENELQQTQTVDRVLRATQAVAFPDVPYVPDIVWTALRLPARRALYLCGVGLLPAALRARCDIHWSRRDEVEFQIVGRAMRSLTPVLPESFKITGPAQLRWRRQAIAGGPLGPDADREAAGNAPADRETAANRAGNAPADRETAANRAPAAGDRETDADGAPATRAA